MNMLLDNWGVFTKNTLDLRMYWNVKMIVKMLIDQMLLKISIKREYYKVINIELLYTYKMG